MKRNMLVFQYSIALMLAVASGCSSPVQGTLTPSPSAAILQIASAAVPTGTALPTPTPLPPITKDNAADVIAGLLRKNGGCQLPCLFGLNPEISDPASINAFVQYFQKNAMETENLTLGGKARENPGYDNSGDVYLIFQKDDIRVFLAISYYYQDGQFDRLTLGSDTTRLGDYLRDYNVGYNAPYGKELLEYYLLPNVLTLYGPPSEIIIYPFATDPSRPNDPYPFSLVLYYKEHNFVVEYVSLRQEQGEYFIGCQPTSNIDLATWSPHRQMSLLDAIERFYGDGIKENNAQFFKRLEDVTEYSISEFYDTFTNLEAQKCIQTPKDLWPESFILTP